MVFRVYRALIASVGAVVLVLSAHEAVARSGAGARGGVARPFLAHRQAFRNFGVFWPGYGDFGYGQSSGYGEPAQGIPPLPTSTDVRYTQTYDVPWDWAHRFPPNVTPSDKPYVSSCPVEVMTFHGTDGVDKTVNIMRCY